MRLVYLLICCSAWGIMTLLHPQIAYIFVFAVLLAAFAGIWFGRKHNVAELFYGLVFTVLVALPLCVSNAMNKEPLAVIIRNRFDTLNPILEYSLFSDRLHGWLTWVPICIVFVIVINIYIIFLNCRLLCKKPLYGAAAGTVCTVLSGGVAMLCFFNLLILRTFVLTANQVDSAMLYRDILFEIITTSAIMLILPMAWTFRSLRIPAGNNIGVLFKDVAKVICVFVAIWLLAAAVARGYTKATINYVNSVAPAEKRPGIPQKLLDADKEYMDWQDAFFKDNPDIKLPLASTYNWLKLRGKRSSGNVTENMKQHTLEWFQSKEGEEFFQRTSEQISRYVEEIPVFNFNRWEYYKMLTGWRMVARFICSRAVLYAYLDRPEDVLPGLDELVVMENTIDEYKQTPLEHLVLIACRALRLYTVIQFGPEGRQYAPFYRRELDLILNKKSVMSCEAWSFTEEAEKVIYLRPGNLSKNSSFLTRLISFPAYSVLLSRLARAHIDVWKRIQKELSAEMCVEEHEVLRVNSIYNTILVRTEFLRSFYSLGLALKLYYCQNGNYPKTLTNLVPEYLSELPRYPVAGTEFNYKVEPGGGIVLSTSPPKGYFIRLPAEFN
jgi:hypothetical protein